MRFEGSVHIQAGTPRKPNFLDKLRELLVKATDRRTAGLIIVLTAILFDGLLAS